ncbi:hypothetical protein JHK84_028910 [Glycine max]|uniref:Uncharacterized protein n=1 Tax=Glycine soja TaxID=3848 RepID=A0A445IPX9_GLYSO|nr:uncharacterized protein LOC114370046 [Glycine soja]KAG4983825.1 hypothetical protein JHK87_028574 [Glycine soja]KAG5004643.1 hypothetical protein JHK86_028782 [Glycine max]KAG5152438.1 hypothetical protein JHK84_028910 [Glycine max]RZB88098.1 hypothetical protein D0Y65_027554 [Glycine soja]
MSDDLPLDLEKVKFLLPPYLLNELFGESLTSEDSQNQPTNGILINGEEEVIVRVASFDNQQSNQLVPIYQGVEENVQTLPMHQRYTWAQIVKGEHKNNDFLVGTRASFSPLIPTLRCQKSEGGKSKQDQKASSSGNGAMRK